MKLVYLLLCLIPSLAIADIFKAIDKDGHVTYSSAPIKGGKRVIETPPPTKHSAASQQNFPKVSQATQRGRDGTRRKILEDELSAEKNLLDSAEKRLKIDEASNPKDDEELKVLFKQVTVHQRNIDALQYEISKLKH